MVGSTRRRHGSSGSTSPSSGGESVASSEWDVIEWSEQNSPATEHFSIRTIGQSEVTMNRDSRDFIFHPENNLDDEYKNNDSGYTDPQQRGTSPGTPKYLDLFQPEFLSDDASFDFDAITNVTPDHDQDEPNALSNDLFQINTPNLIWPTLNPLPIHSSDALFDKAPGLVDPSSLDVSHNANTRTPITPILQEWISVEPPVQTRETQIAAVPTVGNLKRNYAAGSSASVAGPSARRRPRSLSPEDIQERMAQSMFCFMVEVSDSNSSRPAKKMRKPNDDQRRKAIAEVRQKGACLRCRLQKLKVIIANSIV